MNEINQAVKDAIILIPSLEPDERLPAYIRELEKSGFGRIVVVDDGSGDPLTALSDYCGIPVPGPLSGLEQRAVRFDGVTEKADMRDTVDAFLR